MVINYILDNITYLKTKKQFLKKYIFIHIQVKIKLCWCSSKQYNHFKSKGKY